MYDTLMWPLRRVLADERNDPSVFGLLFLLAAVFGLSVWLVPTAFWIDALPFLENTTLQWLARYGMLSQPFAVWWTAVATATRNPRVAPWPMIKGFAILQSAGLVLAWLSQIDDMVVSMATALAGTIYMWRVKAVRGENHRASPLGWRYETQLVTVLVGIVATFVLLQPLVQYTYVPTLEYYEVMLRVALGPVMFWQIRAIWHMTVRAFREVCDLRSYTLANQLLYATLQASGFVLSVSAGDRFLAYAMLISLPGVFLTYGIAKVKEVRWGGRIRVASAE